jgi:hypothetical protein
MLGKSLTLKDAHYSGALGGLLELKMPEKPDYITVGLTCFHCLNPSEKGLDPGLLARVRVWQKEGIEPGDNLSRGKWNTIQSVVLAHEIEDVQKIHRETLEFFIFPSHGLEFSDGVTRGRVGCPRRREGMYFGKSSVFPWRDIHILPFISAKARRIRRISCHSLHRSGLGHSFILNQAISYCLCLYL